MTSNRFPGKSMSILQKKPVIQWTIERAKKIKIRFGITPIVVLAVPDTAISEPMLKLAEKLKVENFCGSELNVLKRFYDCARFFSFNVIVRLTGDCPFIDPRICSEVLQLLMWRKVDYTSNIFPDRTYPMGLDCEAFTFDTLEAAFLKAQSPYDLEHVTSWMQRTEGINRANVVQKIDMSHLNWCVNYPEDIERLQQEIKNNQLTVLGTSKNDN